MQVKTFSSLTLDYPINIRRRDYLLTRGGQLIKATLKAESEAYVALLKSVSAFSADFARIAPDISDAASTEPAWRNGWIPALDSALIYAFLRQKNPATYFEVGSGNSTKFARRAIADGKLRTRIVSVDPTPRAEIDHICDEVIRAPFEDLSETDWLQRLSPGDIVFIDNSHRSFQSSDVTVFFTEMLPSLPSSITWGIHDILLPNDYPEQWIERFYNEQYLLAAYLLGGHKMDSVVFPAAFVGSQTDYRPIINHIFRSIKDARVEAFGGAFWMRRHE